MDAAALVVRAGDRVTAAGRLVRNEAGDWFEPPLFAGFLGGAPRGVRAPRHAVRVIGADFDELTNRFEAGGAVEGGATVTGIWSGDRLLAVRQAVPESAPHRLPRWVKPPCPAPAGGWPHLTRGPGGQNLDYDLGDLVDTGAAVEVTVFRPSEDQAVLVVAAGDRDAVEARLRPQLGGLLCVVPSRFTKAELDAVRARLHAHWEEWNLYLCETSSTEDGQACLSAKLTRVLPEIAEWAASLPHGILALDPWLRPADPQPSDP